MNKTVLKQIILIIVLIMLIILNVFIIFKRNNEINTILQKDKIIKEESITDKDKNKITIGEIIKIDGCIDKFLAIINTKNSIYYGKNEKRRIY